MNQQLRAQIPFLGFNSQHPHGNLKPPVSVELTAFSGFLLALHANGAQMNT